MKVSRLIIIIVVVVLIAIVALVAISALAPSGPSSSAWSSAAGYPVQVSGTYGIGGQQCGSLGQRLYCVGGTDPAGGPRSEVYTSSAISSVGNITGWNLDTSSYPQDIANQSCVASSSYVYCVGGTHDDSEDDVASSYFAQVNGSGVVGAWTPTTQFPVPVDTQSCVASSGYIYCVGGYNETDGQELDTSASNSVYYAPIASTGIGNWTETTSYPPGVYLPSCAASGGYIYCLGGLNSNGNAQSADYYAAASSAGVGSWSQTTSYKISASGMSCVVSGGNIYCVGGETQSAFSKNVYYAPVSSTGIGAWTQVSSYPVASATDCVVASSSLYCVGGFDGSSVGENSDVYFAPLASL